MSDFPLHPTLFISLAILVGFAISPLLAYVDNKSPIENNTSNANNLLNATWWLAAAFGISLLVIYNTKEAIEAKETVMALAPLGMMIAAMIASASVMKNIAATKENEEKKHEKEDSKFYLEKCITYLKEVDELIGKRQNDPFSWKLAADVLITIKKIYPKITENSHESIFVKEYNTSSFKLLQSFINCDDGNQDPITTSFFCSRPYDKNITVTDEYIKNIITKTTIIHPMSIIPIFQFAQPKNNKFLTKSINHNQWRTTNFDHLNKELPWILVPDYLELYKKNIQEKDQQ